VTSTEWPTPVTGPDVTTVVRSPVLTIAKQALSPVLPRGRLNYALNVANRGGADATGVIATDALPANTWFFTASHGGREENGAITWENLAVASNASLRGGEE
jgi:uncharacterized repeat protein (TIGR01451 family)